MQAAFLLLFRKLIKTEGIEGAGNLHLPVPTLWVLEVVKKVFGVDFKRLSKNVFVLQDSYMIAEDTRFVYKVCESE